MGKSHHAISCLTLSNNAGGAQKIPGMFQISSFNLTAASEPLMLFGCLSSDRYNPTVCYVCKMEEEKFRELMERMQMPMCYYS